jgi:tRNA threonylcarbamoyladenosine biosynthesis protein TsaB
MSDIPLILSIETASLACSVAVFQGDKVITHRHDVGPSYVHAERLLPFVDQVLLDAGIASKDLSAISVSAGPGSYTGLRIGVATAKGLCHALGIPLIATDPLESMAFQTSRTTASPPDAVIAVMDARRDEVYTATFAPNGSGWTLAQPTRALVLEAEAGLEKLFPFAANQPNIVVIGDAAQKTQRLLGSLADSWTFIEGHPNAVDTHATATKRYANDQFEDLAYFEPRYLKEFIAGRPRDPLGLRNRAIDSPHSS